MAPKKRAGRPADTEADTDDKTEPCWDSSHRNLRLYLLPLKRWLPRQHPQLNNFIRYGCRRGKMVCEQVGVEARMGSTREGH